MDLLEGLDKRIKVKLTQLYDSLGDGVPESYAEYQKLVGEIAGIEWTRGSVKDMFHAYVDDEDY